MKTGTHRIGSRITVTSAAVLVIASCLDWYVEIVPMSDWGPPDSIDAAVHLNAWDLGLVWSGVPVLISAVMAVAVPFVASPTGNERPDAWGRALRAAAVVTALIVISKLLSGQHDTEGFSRFEPAFGLYLAFSATIGLAVGVWIASSEACGPVGSPTSNVPLPAVGASPPPPPPGGSWF